MKKLNELYLALSPDKASIVIDGVWTKKDEAEKALKSAGITGVSGTIKEFRDSISALVNKTKNVTAK